MKLIASVLFAAALASPSGRGRSGSGSAKSGSPASPGSGRSASSMWDDVLSGIMGSPSHDGDKHSGKSHSGREEHSGRPRPGHGDHDKPEHHDGKPEHHDQKPQKGEKGCNGCGGAVNSNYAPMNSNVQNFVNIETDVNTNVNMNMGGFGYKKPNMHHDWDKEHHDGKDPAEHPTWVDSVTRSLTCITIGTRNIMTTRTRRNIRHGDGTSSRTWTMATSRWDGQSGVAPERFPCATSST